MSAWEIVVETEIPSFNSPYKGVKRSDRVVVGSTNANGEIGFSSLSHIYVTEPDSGVNKVSLELSSLVLSNLLRTFLLVWIGIMACIPIVYRAVTNFDAVVEDEIWLMQLSFCCFCLVCFLLTILAHLVFFTSLYYVLLVCNGENVLVIYTMLSIIYYNYVITSLMICLII